MKGWCHKNWKENIAEFEDIYISFTEMVAGNLEKREISDILLMELAAELCLRQSWNWQVTNKHMVILPVAESFSFGFCNAQSDWILDYLQFMSNTRAKC